MSAPGRGGRGLLGWALVVMAAALIGGLAAAALVHASLIVAVVVSVVIGAIGAVVVLRSPAREPELTSPRTTTMPRAQARRAAPPPESYPPDPVAPGATVPVPAAPGGLNRGGAPAVNETVVQLLPLTPPGTEGPADAPWWDSAQPALRRVPARHQAGQECLGFPLRGVREHLELATGHAVAASPGHAPLNPLMLCVITRKQRRSFHV